MEFQAKLDGLTAGKIVKRLAWMLLLLFAIPVALHVLYAFDFLYAPFFFFLPMVFIHIMRNAKVVFESEAMYIASQFPFGRIEIRYEDIVSVETADVTDAYKISSKSPPRIMVIIEVKNGQTMYFMPVPAEITDSVVSSIQAHGVSVRHVDAEEVKKRQAEQLKSIGYDKQ